MKQQTIELGWRKGMWSAGNPATTPKDYARLIENMVFRPGPRLEKRAPFTDDSRGNCVGLALWSDPSNKVQRVVAFASNSFATDVYVKDVSGNGWSSAYTVTAVGDTPSGVAAYTNYRDHLYYIVGETNMGSNSDPGHIHAFNGTALETNAIGGETLRARTISSFVDRLILGHVQAVVTNHLGTTNAYDATGWSATTTTRENITQGSTVIGRITPTATTNSKIYIAAAASASASASETSFVFRSDFRNTSPSYEMPLTTEIYYSSVWVADTATVLGTIRVPTTAGGNGFRYRASAVAGDTKTAAVTEPTWPTTIGDTVVDDQVTWTCEGLDAVASTPVTLPTLTASANWTPVFTRAIIPTLAATTTFGVRVKFGTTAVSTITLAAVDISLKDGVSDGAINKRNYGQQLTSGKFFKPFINRQSTASGVTIGLTGDVYWTETSDPDSIDANNFFKLTELPGNVTAAAVVGGRYIVFKRRGMWIFQGSADPDNPLVKERFFAHVGAVFEGGVTVFEDKLYWIGENGVYAYEPGGEPVEICGDGMREEIVANTSLFTTFPSIGVDELNRDIWLSVKIRQSTPAHVYVYDLDSGAWTRQSVALSGVSTQTIGMFTFQPSNGTLYCGVKDDSLSTFLDVHRLTATTGGDGTAASSVTAYITPAPIELMFPRREIALDEVGTYNSVTGSQTNNTFTVGVSLDGGNTFGKTNSVTIPTQAAATVADRLPVPLRQSGQRLMVRLAHAGDAGATMFNVSAIDAVVRDLGPQRTISTPTQGSASL
jgi:hypothetical protein